MRPIAACFQRQLGRMKQEEAEEMRAVSVSYFAIGLYVVTTSTITIYFSMCYHTKYVLLKAGCATLKTYMYNITIGTVNHIQATIQQCLKVNV